jgi:hypothetical protein
MPESTTRQISQQGSRHHRQVCACFHFFIELTIFDLSRLFIIQNLLNQRRGLPKQEFEPAPIQRGRGNLSRLDFCCYLLSCVSSFKGRGRGTRGVRGGRGGRGNISQTFDDSNNNNNNNNNSNNFNNNNNNNNNNSGSSR